MTAWRPWASHLEGGCVLVPSVCPVLGLLQTRHRNRFIQREIPTKACVGRRSWRTEPGPRTAVPVAGPHPSMAAAPVPHCPALSALGRGWLGRLLAVAHPHHTFLGPRAAHAPSSGPLLQRLHCSHLTESCPAPCLSLAQPYTVCSFWGADAEKTTFREV